MKTSHRNLILLSVIGLGAAFRFYGIRSGWFGFDENVTLYLSQTSWFLFERIMWMREMNMVGYYVIVRLWLNLDPYADTLVFVRVLSALFSIATIPILYALGKKLFNEKVGLLAAGLLAINAFHIKHAQNARCYAMFVFLVTLATLLLVNNMRNPNPNWTAYTCLWVFTIYTHVFAFWFLAAHVLLMIYTGVRPKIIQLACLFIGSTPMALWTATHRGLPLNWVQPTTVRSVAGLFAIFVGDDGLFLLLIAVVAMLPLLFDLVKAGEKGEQKSVKLLLIWALAPVALTIAISWIQPCFVPRYLIPCVPATTLLTAASIERYKLLPAMLLLVLIVFGMLNGSQFIGA